MELIFDLIFVIIVVGTCALFAHFVCDKNKPKPNKMSFREAMDLTGLPIVTFKQGENKLNFVLDTGAFSSLLDARILDTIEYTLLEGTSVGYGIDGKEHTMERVGLILSYKDKEYSDTFRVLDMSKSFDSLKRDYGVTVHGLLSSSFFERYKYILDYNELVAYSVV